MVADLCDRLLYVAPVLFNFNVMNSWFQYATVFTLNKDLAGFGNAAFKMPRRYGKKVEVAIHTRETGLLYFIKRCVRPSTEIIIYERLNLTVGVNHTRPPFTSENGSASAEEFVPVFPEIYILGCIRRDINLQLAAAACVNKFFRYLPFQASMPPQIIRNFSGTITDINLSFIIDEL